MQLKEDISLRFSGLALMGALGTSGRALMQPKEDTLHSCSGLALMGALKTNHSPSDDTLIHTTSVVCYFLLLTTA